ncbi:LapA family protein [Pseudalkalibacillus caeni]|uniref:DUF1049 domain-containing protein n=1 Tax=Exobacillus caeni TaxID=2574798 RepID=A0A5R9FAQ4_9BACL|nr:lipopolysaccharide assembly protein LapA domain-containing protein [Pseudalkalibacillus caeni]TLS39276.1 DUF1049 domain-containing protein [Pseudalkalibacillus caeni]
MKKQWGLIIALIFALVIAVFAVINVDPVEVNYLFGTSEWPLVLVILGSVLMGGLLVLGVGLVRYYKLLHEIRSLKKENGKLQEELESTQGPTENHEPELDSLNEEEENFESNGNRQ